jgi:hypothetical protein
MSRPAGDTILTIVPPPGEDWETVDTEIGRYFVRAIDGMADLVAFFAVTSRPGSQGVQTLDQLDQVLQLTASERYPTRKQDLILGVPVIRYESLRKDSMDGSDLFRQKLGLRQRPSGYQYAVREKGVFMLHPTNPGYIVRVGCARTSYHGLLGSHYEGVAEAFIEAFIAENPGAGTASVPAYGDGLEADYRY